MIPGPFPCLFTSRWFRPAGVREPLGLRHPPRPCTTWTAGRQLLAVGAFAVYDQAQPDG